jgi:hypothetical protein
MLLDHLPAKPRKFLRPALVAASNEGFCCRHFIRTAFEGRLRLRIGDYRILLSPTEDGRKRTAMRLTDASPVA